MNKLKMTGTALAMSAAALLTVAPVYADTATTNAATVLCKGVNSCKGQSTCKTSENSCKGTNSCKGKGVVEMTSEQCQAAGGTVEEKKAAE